MATQEGPASVEAHPDMLTVEQLEGIKKEIAAEQPMIGPFEPLNCLLAIYEGSTSVGFVPGIKFLDERYVGMRRIRGDGNCFYRGLLFGYLNTLLESLKSNDSALQLSAEAEYDRIKSKIQGSMEDLVAVGYSEFTIEVFYDVSIIASRMVLDIWQMMGMMNIFYFTGTYGSTYRFEGSHH